MVALRDRVARISTPVLLLIPAAALLGWLMVYPMISAVHLGFTSWDGFSAPTGVGLDNFEALLHDKRFKEAVVHNLVIVAALPIWIGLPYGVASALHRKVLGWQVFRFVFFLPVALSPVVIGTYYSIVLRLDGPFNDLLSAIGLGFVAQDWLNDPSITLMVVTAILVWATFGIGVLIFLAGLASVDPELIDAARVDGASPWQVQRHVVFWQLLPVIEFWAVLIVIASFTAFFPLIYTLTHGGPGHATYTVDYDLYVEAFHAGHLGYAAAIGVASMLVIAAVGGIVVGLLRMRRRVT